MKKVITILVLAAIIAAAYITCPSKSRHEEVIKSAVSEAVDELADDYGVNDNVVGGLLKGLTTGVISTGINMKLDYKNYFLFSLCKMKVEGEKRTVSLGLFNKIITMDKDDILEALGKETSKDKNKETKETDNK